MGDFRDIEARLVDAEEYMIDRDWRNMYITPEEYDKAQAMVDGVRWARHLKEIRDLEALWDLGPVEPKRNLN